MVKQKNWGPYVHMNNRTLLGIREKTHERRCSHRDTRLQQGDVAMEAHVASVCFKCFKRFRGMLQLFHMDVAKVDQGCCTYCKCFRGILQLFHMDVAKVDQGCCTYCKCFRGMLQVFQRCCSKCFIVLDICCKHSDLGVAHVSHICCKNMFDMF
jgi:hypothetical protein